MRVPTQQSKQEVGSLHANDYLFAVLVPHDPKDGPVVVPGTKDLRSITFTDYERVISALREAEAALVRAVRPF